MTLPPILKKWMGLLNPSYCIKGKIFSRAITLTTNVFRMQSFGFKSGICLLIAPVPVHFFSITLVARSVIAEYIRKKRKWNQVHVHVFDLICQIMIVKGSPNSMALFCMEIYLYKQKWQFVMGTVLLYE